MATRQEPLYRAWKSFNLAMVAYALTVLALLLVNDAKGAKTLPPPLPYAIFTLLVVSLVFLGMLFWLMPVIVRGGAEEERIKAEKRLLYN